MNNSDYGFARGACEAIGAPEVMPRLKKAIEDAAVAAERKEAVRKLLAEVDRLKEIEDGSGSNYYYAHAQALYNWVRKEYPDVMRPGEPR